MILHTFGVQVGQVDTVCWRVANIRTIMMSAGPSKEYSLKPHGSNSVGRRLESPPTTHGRAGPED